jgi:hypothetical protein
MTLASEISMNHPANQGLCKITGIEPGFSDGAKGYLLTNLSEKFPVFSANVIAVAEHCLAKHLPVKLLMRRSVKGDHYVSAILPVDFTRTVQPCVNCGEPASRHDDGPRAAWFFECAVCHFRAFESVPRYRKVVSA